MAHLPQAQIALENFQQCTVTPISHDIIVAFKYSLC